MVSFTNHFVYSNAWGYRLMRHAAFWVSSLAIFTVMDMPNDLVTRMRAAVFSLPFNMLYVYVLRYYFVPRLLMRSAYLRFFLYYCVWLLVNLMIEYYLLHYAPGSDLKQIVASIFDTTTFTVTNVIAAFAIGIILYRYWRAEVWQKMQAKQEKTKAELELLKAQLHPHFLFNTLNNLYALVVEQSDKAPEMLMRLSAILSYVLYECRSDEVPLAREISICKDYVELERVRYGDRLDISLDFSGPTAGKMVTPMLFQPFIEHAFRYGACEQEGKVWMSIELSVLHNQLFFRVINSVNFEDEASPPGPDGPGLENIIRRLELLYPHRYQLTRDKGEGVYIASLTIDLIPTTTAGLAPADNKKEPELYENAVFNY